MIRRRPLRWYFHRLRQTGMRTITVRVKLKIRNHVVMP